MTSLSTGQKRRVLSFDHVMSWNSLYAAALIQQLRCDRTQSTNLHRLSATRTLSRHQYDPQNAQLVALDSPESTFPMRSHRVGEGSASLYRMEGCGLSKPGMRCEWYTWVHRSQRCCNLRGQTSKSSLRSPYVGSKIR